MGISWPDGPRAGSAATARGETGTVRTDVRGRVWAQLRATRGAWVYGLLTLIGIVSGVVVIHRTWQVVRAPDVGVKAERHLQVRAVDPRWSTVQRGDRVVAVNGESIASERDWELATRRLDPGPVELTFERDSRRWTETSDALARAPALGFAIWIDILVGLAVFVLAAVSFAARPGTRPTWLLFLFGWSLAVGTQWGTSLRVTRPELDLLVSMLTVVTGGAGLHFFCVFPRVTAFLADKPWRAIWVYVPSGAIAAVQLVQSVRQGTLAADPGLQDLLQASIGGLALFGAGVMVVNYRRAAREDDIGSVARYRIMLIATVVGIVVPAQWHALRHLGMLDSPLAQHYNGVPVVFFVALAGYTVVRHNALELDRFTAAVVGYAVSATVAAAVFGSFVAVVPMLLRDSVPDRAPVWISLTTVVILSCMPL